LRVVRWRTAPGSSSSARAPCAGFRYRGRMPSISKFQGEDLTPVPGPDGGTQLRVERLCYPPGSLNTYLLS
jgi:hypothetical protein